MSNVIYDDHYFSFVHSIIISTVAKLILAWAKQSKQEVKYFSKIRFEQLLIDSCTVQQQLESRPIEP